MAHEDGYHINIAIRAGEQFDGKPRYIHWAAVYVRDAVEAYDRWKVLTEAMKTQGDFSITMAHWESVGRFCDFPSPPIT